MNVDGTEIWVCENLRRLTTAWKLKISNDILRGKLNVPPADRMWNDVSGFLRFNLRNWFVRRRTMPAENKHGSERESSLGRALYGKTNLTLEAWFTFSQASLFFSWTAIKQEPKVEAKLRIQRRRKWRTAWPVVPASPLPLPLFRGRVA